MIGTLVFQRELGRLERQVRLGQPSTRRAADRDVDLEPRQVGGADGNPQVTLRTRPGPPVQQRERYPSGPHMAAPRSAVDNRRELFDGRARPQDTVSGRDEGRQIEDAREIAPGAGRRGQHETVFRGQVLVRQLPSMRTKLRPTRPGHRSARDGGLRGREVQRVGQVRQPEPV
jgi:hypothetical protein